MESTSYSGNLGFWPVAQLQPGPVPKQEKHQRKLAGSIGGENQTLALSWKQSLFLFLSLSHLQLYFLNIIFRLWW